MAFSPRPVRAEAAELVVSGSHTSHGPHFEALLAPFPSRATTRPIDATVPRAGFASIFQLHRSYGWAVCVDPLLDVDPTTPGDQYECVVELFDFAAKTSALWPRCGGGATPCWDLVPDPLLCMNGGLALDVDFGPDKLPYEGGALRGQCLSQ